MRNSSRVAVVSCLESYRAAQYACKSPQHALPHRFPRTRRRATRPRLGGTLSNRRIHTERSFASNECGSTGVREGECLARREFPAGVEGSCPAATSNSVVVRHVSRFLVSGRLHGSSNALFMVHVHDDRALLKVLLLTAISKVELFRGSIWSSL